MISENEQKYWDRQREFIHPYISFLVSGMSDIRSIITTSFTSSEAVFTLETFILFLDPDIQEHLKDETAQLDKWQKNPTGISRDRIIVICRKISRELHLAGYFAGARIKTIEIGGENPRRMS